ncbi:MAG: hypothetical protein PSV35_08525, partial [bacterium]|nr:hypothetical protein [bacterium]
PSLSAWANEQYSSEDFVDTSLKANQFKLPWDSIITTSRAMMAHMEMDTTHWDYCDELIIEKKVNPLEARTPKAWRDHVAKLFSVAEEKRASVVSAFKEIDPLNIIGITHLLSDRLQEAATLIRLPKHQAQLRLT